MTLTMKAEHAEQLVALERAATLYKHLADDALATGRNQSRWADETKDADMQRYWTMKMKASYGAHERLTGYAAALQALAARLKGAAE